MFIDNLTLSGISVVSLFLLLPLFFGKELLRVKQESKQTQQKRNIADDGLQQSNLFDC